MARTLVRSVGGGHLNSDHFRADVAPAQVTGPFTIEGWIKCGINTQAMAVWFAGDKDVSNQYYLLQVRGDVAGDPINFWSRGNPDPSTNTKVAQTTTGITVGTWHHVAGVEASATSRACYIDGGSKGTNAGDATPAGIDRTAIGVSPDSIPDSAFDGAIAEFRMWDGELTDSDIAALAGGADPSTITTASIIHRWGLCEDGSLAGAIDDIGGLDLAEFSVNNGGIGEEAHPVGVDSVCDAGGGAFTLTAESGAISVTGTAAGLKADHQLAAASGAIAVAGTPADLRKGPHLVASAGAISVTGTAAGLAVGHKLSAQGGSVSITGTDATLVHDATDPTLSAESGTIGLTGTPLVFELTVFGTSGSIALTGTAASLTHGYRLNAEAGAVSVTGPAAGTKAGRQLSAGSGAVTVTGSDATLTYTTPGAFDLVAESEAITLAGTAATLRMGHVVAAGAGAVSLSGAVAGLASTRRLVAEGGAISISGTTAAFAYSGNINRMRSSRTYTGPRLTGRPHR